MLTSCTVVVFSLFCHWLVLTQVSDINKYNIIAIGAEGIDIGRKGQLGWIQVSHPDNLGTLSDVDLTKCAMLRLGSVRLRLLSYAFTDASDSAMFLVSSGVM
jgi:hypothetical protein